MDQTDARISAVREIGPADIAVDIETPDGFDARPGQFVKLTGAGESRFYTISSPDVDGTFEVTVEVDPEGTLGPWLAERDPGDTVAVTGPFGNAYYEDEPRVVVLAGGPGVTSMSDEAHKGKSTRDFEDADLQVGSESQPETTETSQDEPGEPAPSSEGQTTSPDGGDPVSTSTTPVDTPSGATGDPECPSCGGSDYFDPAEALEQLGEDPSEWDVSEYDYGCPDCSTQKEWEVWSE